MKKLTYILSSIIIVFLCMPTNSLAAEYKVCQYDKGGLDAKFNGTLRVSGSKVVFQMYNGTEKIEKNVDASPSILLGSCPQTLCEDTADDGIVTIASSCGLKAKYNLIGETTTSAVKGLNEAVLYTFGIGNQGAVNYPTIFDGGCPSDVSVFKLFGTVYDLLKIATPVILVLFATIDLAKAVAAQDDGMIKKAQKHCIKRVAAAIIVLLSFFILEFLVELVAGGSDVMGCVNELLN